MLQDSDTVNLAPRLGWSLAGAPALAPPAPRRRRGLAILLLLSLALHLALVAPFLKTADPTQAPPGNPDSIEIMPDPGVPDAAPAPTPTKAPDAAAPENPPAPAAPPPPVAPPAPAEAVPLPVESPPPPIPAPAEIAPAPPPPPPPAPTEELPQTAPSAPAEVRLSSEPPPPPMALPQPVPIPAAPAPLPAPPPPHPPIPAPRPAPSQALRLPFAWGGGRPLSWTAPDETQPSKERLPPGAMNLALGPAAQNSRGSVPHGSQSEGLALRVVGADVGPDWGESLFHWWLQHRYYPKQALENGEDGMVKLHLVVDRLGKVHEAQIQTTSGSQWIDMGALATFRNANLPPFPEGAKGDQADLYLDINYYLIRR